MKKITLVITGAMFLFVGYTNLPDPMSMGAPECSTGAPGERHCATSGCHSSFPVNSGSALLSISIDNGAINYEPGKTYPVTVSITNPGTMRFGFQLTSLRVSDNASSGTLKLVDASRTQLQSGFGALAERKYITYTYAGTKAVSAGIGKWSFEWTAPETNEGAVTFYAASISANDDGTDAGDYVYTQKITLDAPKVFWNVFPAISSSKITVQSSEMVIDRLHIFNSSGETVFEKTNLQPGMIDVELQQSGIYFVAATHDGKTEFRKILIAR